MTVPAGIFDVLTFFLSWNQFSKYHRHFFKTNNVRRERHLYSLRKTCISIATAVIFRIMSVKCPKCNREYDVTLFEFGKKVRCDCGTSLGMAHEEVFDQLAQICRQYDLEVEEEKLAEIKRAHDKIVFLILNSDYQPVDIEIEKSKFKDLIAELFPEKTHLYELIYEPRFKRLWEQFRSNP